MEQFKVTSEIVNLDQRVGGITKQHRSSYPRTVTWLKDEEEDDFFTREEAEIVKTYLDKKKENFANNKIEAISEDDDPSVAELAIDIKKVENGSISYDEPIEITQCDALKDCDISFPLRGYLNVNQHR